MRHPATMTMATSGSRTVEPPGQHGMLDVAAGARGEALVRAGQRQTVVQEDLAQLGCPPVQPPGQPEALREHPHRVVHVGGELSSAAPYASSASSIAAWNSSSLVWKWL